MSGKKKIGSVVHIDEKPTNITAPDLTEVIEIDTDDNVKDDPEVLFLNQLLEDHPDLTEDEPVADQDKANAILYVVGQIIQEMKGISEVAQKQIDRAKMYEEREHHKRQRSIDFLTARLHFFASTSGKRTINLPNGTLKLIKRQDKVEYIDPEKVIEWIKNSDRPDLIRVKEEPNKTEIKKYFKETGEIPDGIEITPQDDTFKVVTE